MSSVDYDRYNPIVGRVAGRLHSQFPMLDKNDIVQECWVLVSANYKSYDSYDDPHVTNTLRKVVRRWCLGERGEYLHQNDWWLYSRDEVERLLSVFVQKDWGYSEALPDVKFGHLLQEGQTWTPVTGFSASNGWAQAEHGNVLAGLYDLSEVWPKLSHGSKKVLFLRHTRPTESWEVLGVEANIQGDSFRRKYQRAADSLARMMNQSARYRHELTSMRRIGAGSDI